MASFPGTVRVLGRLWRKNLGDEPGDPLPDPAFSHKHALQMGKLRLVSERSKSSAGSSRARTGGSGC